jgi:hypothetical protein
MKNLLKTVLAILFALALIEVWMLFRVHESMQIEGYGWILLAVVVAFFYYQIFERKKKTK